MYTFKWYREVEVNGEWQEEEYKVTGHVIGGLPGRYSGPPEDCCEAEMPEPSIDRITEDNGKHVPWERFSDEEYESMCEKLIEMYYDDDSCAEYERD